MLRPVGKIGAYKNEHQSLITGENKHFFNLKLEAVK